MNKSLVKNKKEYQLPKRKNAAVDEFCDYISNFAFGKLEMPQSPSLQENNGTN